jgi:CheY-like chemotaxis protein
MISTDRTLRILLVEDHVATASALARALLRYGFAVAPANSASAALEVARLQEFDLLITDIGLPQKNGWELFRELRRLQPQLVGIAVTGYAYPEDVRRSLEVGIQLHLKKPATIQQVLQAIGRLFPKPGVLKLLYLEDDARDIELFQFACQKNDPDCELIGAMDREAFVTAVKIGGFDGILSDSGVPDLPGPDAVRLARRLAPGLPYVFLCGVMDAAKRAGLVAANPDGIFSKDQPDDPRLAINLIRAMKKYRAGPGAGRPD